VVALADCIDWSAALHCTLGRPLDAARLFGAAEAIWIVSGARRWVQMRPNYERDLADLRRRLDPDELQVAWREGTTWSAEDAVDYALTTLQQRTGPTVA
jgi:hypothetical protein